MEKEEGDDIKLKYIFNMSKSHILKDIKKSEDLLWKKFYEMKSLSDGLE